MSNQPSPKHGKIPLASSIAIALFCSTFPWWYYRAEDYVDRANNLFFIDRVPSKIYWFDFDGIVTKVMNEWGWHRLLLFLVEDLSMTGSQILGLISFISVLVAALFICRRYHPYAALLLIHPVFIDFAVSQSRLALAMALVTISYSLYIKERREFLIPLAISPFIHTSAILFIFMIGTTLLSRKFLSSLIFTRAVIATLAGLVVSIVTGPLLSSVLTSLEDRRAYYDDMTSPILYSLFWIGLYFSFLLASFANRGAKSDSFYISISVLSIVFFSLFFSGYPLRFVAACFPFIICALLNLEGRFKVLLLISYVLAAIGFWLFWLS